MTYRAFVSSTFADLGDHRRKAIAALREAGFDVDPMEDWTAASDEPAALSTDRLKGCDLCILLVAFRRGHIPDGDALSITQQEYRAAIDRKIDVLPFLLRENAAWPRDFDEMKADSEVGKWRAELCERHVVGFFSTDPESLPIEPALTRWVTGRAAPPKPSSFGLVVSQTEQVHRYLNDAGDFELQYIHTVQNTGHIGVSQLLPDSVSFFLPDGETLRTVAAVDCRIVDRNASAFAIELEECAFGHVKTTKINGRPTDLAHIYWRPRVSPALPPNMSLRYACIIKTRGTEKSAFEGAGSVAGFDTKHPVERLLFRCEAPDGYEIDAAAAVPYTRAEDGSAINLPDLPQPLFAEQNRVLTMVVHGDALQLLVNYLIPIRFLRTEGRE